MKTNQESLQQWQSLIQEQQASGLSIRKWCDQNNIKQCTFFYWKKRLSEKPEKEICFAEISLAKVPTASPVNTDPFEAPVHIRYRDFEVLVGKAATCFQLTEVLEALRRSC